MAQSQTPATKDKFTSVSISLETRQLLDEIVGHYQQLSPTPGAKFPIRGVLAKLVEDEHQRIKNNS